MAGLALIPILCVCMCVYMCAAEQMYLSSSLVANAARTRMYRKLSKEGAHRFTRPEGYDTTLLFFFWKLLIYVLYTEPTFSTFMLLLWRQKAPNSSIQLGHCMRFGVRCDMCEVKKIIFNLFNVLIYLNFLIFGGVWHSKVLRPVSQNLTSWLLPWGLRTGLCQRSSSSLTPACRWVFTSCQLLKIQKNPVQAVTYTSMQNDSRWKLRVDQWGDCNTTNKRKCKIFIMRWHSFYIAFYWVYKVVDKATMTSPIGFWSHG